MSIEHFRFFMLIVGVTLALLAATNAFAQSDGDAVPKPAPAPMVAEEDSRKFPQVQPSLDPGRLGTGVQRTMKLLATSTREHRNKVRILVYGQSISEQDWWKQVAADLRKRFPYADLDIQNRAIGGFASQLLVKSAEADLYPFYPDLTILHDYGAHDRYEDIVRKLRSTTTSELLIQTDHVTAWPNPGAKQGQPMWWDHMMNDIYLPKFASKYECGLCDVRGEWLRYLKDNHLEPKQLTIDGTHLNAQGNFLMAQVISRHLVYRPELDDAGWKNSVTDHPVQWSNGRFRMEFTGNRIDAVTDAGATTGEAAVLIDGKKPSEFQECYYASRPSPGPWSPLFIARVDHVSPLVLEIWTYKVTSVAEDGKSWHFDLSGSVTGPDGSGDSTQTFSSHSGRVKLEPASYFRGFYKPFSVGFESKWEVKPLFTDTYKPSLIETPGAEHLTILAQGLPPGKHTIELTAMNAAPPIQTLRVYNPPYVVQPEPAKN